MDIHPPTAIMLDPVAAVRMMGRKLSSSAYSDVYQWKKDAASEDSTCVGSLVVKVSRRKPLPGGDDNPVPGTFPETASKNLMHEAKMMESLDHPHLAKLRGILSDGRSDHHQEPPEAPWSSGATKKACRILVDPQSESLSDRLASWRFQQQQRLLWGWSTSKESDLDFLRERLEVALRIASGLEYLHQQRIVFRSLDPKSSIGFFPPPLDPPPSPSSNSSSNSDHPEKGNPHGVIQIHNFSQSLRVPRSNRLPGRNLKRLHLLQDQRLRYAAPELKTGKSYTTKVDVYSFCVLLGEILTLEEQEDMRRTPFANNSKKEGCPMELDDMGSPKKETIQVLKVLQSTQKRRNYLDTKFSKSELLSNELPSNFCDLIKRGLSQSAFYRPTMQELQQALQDAIDRVKDKIAQTTNGRVEWKDEDKNASPVLMKSISFESSISETPTSSSMDSDERSTASRVSKSSDSSNVAPQFEEINGWKEVEGGSNKLSLPRQPPKQKSRRILVTHVAQSDDLPRNFFQIDATGRILTGRTFEQPTR